MNGLLVIHLLWRETTRGRTDSIATWATSKKRFTLTLRNTTELALNPLKSLLHFLKEFCLVFWVCKRLGALFTGHFIERFVNGNWRRHRIPWQLSGSSNQTVDGNGLTFQLVSVHARMFGTQQCPRVFLHRTIYTFTMSNFAKSRISSTEQVNYIVATFFSTLMVGPAFALAYAARFVKSSKVDFQS